MITASQLLRHCGYPRALRAVPPANERERAARARRDEAAARGTTFHAAVEAWVKTGTTPVVEDPEIQGWLDLLVAQWAPRMPVAPRTAPETWTEFAWGLNVGGGWMDVEEPEPHCYVPRGWKAAEGDYRIMGLLTAGRADAWWHGGDGRMYVVDWKTGRWPVAPAAQNLQVNAAAIAIADHACADAYVPGIYYTRDGVFDWGDPVHLYGVEVEDLPIFQAIKGAALLDNEPRPGDHCGTCWERRACPHAMTPRSPTDAEVAQPTR